jgi:integration host factor subunit alpha
MSLTKQDIANTLVKETNLTQTQALVLTNEFFDQITQQLGKGKNVKLSSFGNFILREKSERPGRNPKTGEEVMISARKVVTFKAGPKLKKATQKGSK